MQVYDRRSHSPHCTHIKLYLFSNTEMMVLGKFILPSIPVTDVQLDATQENVHLSVPRIA